MKNDELIKQVTLRAQEWLSEEYDEQTRKEVRELLEAPDKTPLIDAFYKDLEFGTGGLRGIMGVGCNRMNIYTVAAATQGLVNYLKKSFADEKEIAVVVGYDCRNNSPLFAETVANVCSANGVRVHIFKEMRPTPQISYAIRHLGCKAGVMITASHNPKEYNGYKAYWEDGAQVLAPHDVGIIKEVQAIASMKEVKQHRREELVHYLAEEIDHAYLTDLQGVCIDPQTVKKQHDLNIVYTPIHGTGMTMIPKSLANWGFTNVHTVKEQMVEDGNFSTVQSPNPENPEAMSMALKLAKEIGADLIMASDPDADRIGVGCKDGKGDYVLLNGNQTCLVFLYYITTRYKELGRLDGSPFCVKTIVTTELIKKVAEKNEIKLLDCYTGFKWIAREIRLREGKEKFIGGGEESYGFLAQDFVRDKDAVSACCLMAEIAAWAKEQGKTLFDLLMEVYVAHGYSKEETVNVVKPGKSGAEEIKAMMDNYRANPPQTLAGEKVVCVKDYATLTATGNGQTSKIEMPEPSNVLQFFTENGSKVSVRPSGTEPKIKFYFEIKAPMACRNCYLSAQAEAKEKFEAMHKDLGV